MPSDSDTIFGKIIRKEIPAKIVFESERILAFRDINQVAPTHILIVPKTPLKDLASATVAEQSLLGELLLTAAALAKQEGIGSDGYRVVINTGAAAGQSVFHLHLHLLAGRAFTWPPG